MIQTLVAVEARYGGGVEVEVQVEVEAVGREERGVDHYWHKDEV